MLGCPSGPPGSSGPLSRPRERAGVRVAAGARHIGLQPIEDAQQHRLTLHQHLAVGKAQYVIAQRIEFNGAALVGSHALIAEMLTAIKFDDQQGLKAREVGDIPTHRVLTPELAATDLPIAQGSPQHTLGVRLGLAQLARPVCGAGHRINPHPGPLPGGEGMKRLASVGVVDPASLTLTLSQVERALSSLSRLRERVGVRVWLNAITLTLALSRREREPDSISHRESGPESLSIEERARMPASLTLALSQGERG